MTIEGWAVSIVVMLLLQTGGFVWWAATLTTTVKNHDRQLFDHEERLRQGEL